VNGEHKIRFTLFLKCDKLINGIKMLIHKMEYTAEQSGIMPMI
jgi:hypothetical protein